MWKPGCIFDYIFLCLLVVPAVCFGIARDPCRGEPRTLQRFNNSPEFLQYNSPICALNLELLYGRTLIESNSYHHHHHNGHEICFVLLSNIGEHEICLWSEIIWTREVKLKEMLYQVLAWDTVIKYLCHDVPFRWCSFYMQKKKKQGRSLLKTYSFRCKKSIHALVGKYTIPRSPATLGWVQKNMINHLWIIINIISLYRIGIFRALGLPYSLLSNSFSSQQQYKKVK